MKQFILNHSIVKYLVAPVAFIILLLASQVVFKGARIDLTEQDIYSLTQGTENILANLEQDVSITYFSAIKPVKILRHCAAMPSVLKSC